MKTACLSLALFAAVVVVGVGTVVSTFWFIARFVLEAK